MAINALNSSNFNQIESVSTSQEQALFDAYKAARLQAEKTLDISDAIIAGKAWAAFLRLFEGAQS